MLTMETYRVKQNIGFARIDPYFSSIQESGFGVIKDINKQGHIIVRSNDGQIIEFDKWGHERGGLRRLWNARILRKKVNDQSNISKFTLKAIGIVRYLNNQLEYARKNVAFTSTNKEELLNLVNALDA